MHNNSGNNIKNHPHTLELSQEMKKAEACLCNLAVESPLKKGDYEIV
jgi:hypothetical protein